MGVEEFAKRIVGQKKQKASEGFEGLVSDSQKWAQSEGRKIKQFARRRLDEAWFPNITAIAEGIGTSVAGPLTRPVNPELADRLHRIGAAFEEAASERDVDNWLFSPALARAGRGVAQTLPTMVLGAMAGGAPGAIGIAATQEASRAKTEAKDAGLSERQAAAHAMTQGAIEGGVAGLFQLAGMGGVEKTLGRGLGKAASTGLKQGLKKAGVTALHELPEELLTELGHNVASKMQGVDPAALDWQTTKGTIQDTILQTLLTVGLVGTPNVAQSVKTEKLRRAADEIMEAAKSGKAPSRTQFTDWGFSPVRGKSASDRLIMTMETAAKIQEAREKQAAGQGVTRGAELAETPAGDAEATGVPGEQVSEQLTEDSAMPVAQPPVQPAGAPPAVEPLRGSEAPQGPVETPQEPAEVSSAEPRQAEVPPATALDETSIKNEIVNEIREGRGDTPLAEVPAEKQTQWLDAASERIAQNPDFPVELVEELRKDSRTISDEETAALQIHYRRLNNQFAAAHEAIEAAEEAGDSAARAAAQAEAKRVLDKIEATEEATKAAGREWGRAGVARQMQLKADYSLGTVMRRMRTANGGNELSAADSAKAVELARQLQEAQAKLVEAEAVKTEQDPEVGVERAIKETSRYMLDGKPAAQWMRSALVNRAQRLGIHVGGKSRKQLVERINEAEDRLRAEAERNDIPYRVFLEGIKESYPAIAEYAKLERDAKDRAHKLTGLSQGDVNRLANSGYDYAADPDNVGGETGQKLRHFDEYAQEVASEYPDLFNTWESPSEVLWGLLGRDIPGKIRWDSPRVMEAAAAWVEQNAEGVTEEDLPPIDSTEIQQDYLGEDPTTPDRTSAAGRKQAARKKVADAWADFKSKFAAGPQEGLIGGESGALDLELLESGAKLVRAYAELGKTSFAEFFAEAKAHLGDAADTARDSLKSVWDRAVEAGVIQPPQIDPEDKAAISRYAQKVTRSIVQSGITDREAVVDAVHEELRAIDPDITRRGAMDAISGYGIYSELSKDEVSVAIRDIRGQLQQLAKLEDMAAGRAPQKTGVERRTASDAERQLLKQVNEAKKRGGFDTLDPAKQLKSALDAAKTAARNTIADLEHEIRTREKIVREKTTLKPDAELESLRKRVDELREEHAKVFPKTATLEQRVAAAEKSLDRAIAQLEADLKAGRIGKKPKPAPLSTPSIDAKRAKLETLRAHRQALRDAANPKLSTEEKRTRAYRRHLEKKLADLERRVKEQDFSKKPVKHVKPDEESIEMRYKIRDLKDKLNEMEKAIEKRNLKGLAKVRDLTEESLNASRAIMTSMDFSAVLRQGAFTSYSHPLLTAKAFPDMFRAFYSQEGEYAAMEAIRSRPNARVYEEAKLAIQTTEGSLTKQEEAFFGTWQRFIPGVAGSGRAYVTFLNRVRADVFDALHAELSANGEVSAEEAKMIANFVNVATGRGDVGRHGAGADLLATYFFAPRYMASRFQIVTAQPFRKGNARVKKLVAKEYGRALLGLGTFYGLCALAGYFALDDEDKPQFEWDARSTEFGKVRWGDVIIDPLGGISQTTVLLRRVLGGETKMSTGEIVPIRGEGVPYNGLTTFGAISRFLRGKLAPAPGAAINILAGENIIGEESTVASELQSALVPLSFGDIYDALQVSGVGKKPALAMLVVLGVGANKYQNATPDRFADKIASRQRLKGRNRETGEAYDFGSEVDQIVRQAKKRGLTERELSEAAIARWREEGLRSGTISDRLKRLRSRYRSLGE